MVVDMAKKCQQGYSFALNDQGIAECQESCLERSLKI